MIEIITETDVLEIDAAVFHDVEGIHGGSDAGSLIDNLSHSFAARRTHRKLNENH